MYIYADVYHGNCARINPVFISMCAYLNIDKMYYDVSVHASHNTGRCVISASEGEILNFRGSKPESLSTQTPLQATFETRAHGSDPSNSKEGRGPY